MTFVSHAQNFEDVLLWRALGHVEQGRYLDIGAQDPTVDSVSLAFYDRGWRGVHVEPTPAYAAKLRLARPEELVIEAAVSDRKGSTTIFEFAETGLSTGIKSIAAQHSKAGYCCQAISVRSVTLNEIFPVFENDLVHWMKIDVEGMEASVLRSWGKNEARPWILVIESVHPTTKVSSGSFLSGELEQRGYSEVFFDGLSRYFVHESQRDLAANLNVPANVFDGYVVPSNHFSAAKLRFEAEIVGQERLEQQALAKYFEAQFSAAQQEAESARQDASAAQDRLLEAQSEFDRQDEVLRQTLSETEAVLAVIQLEKVKFEERSSQLEDAVRRLDEIVAARDQQLRQAREKASAKAVEVSRLESVLQQFSLLTEQVLTERPGLWHRIGQRLGLNVTPLAVNALEQWFRSYSGGQQPSQVPLIQVQGQQSIMPTDNRPEGRNPYLRANSLEELMSWHDLDFVRCAYVTLLGRQPDRRGEEFYVDRLRRGYSKYGILWQLRTSRERPRHDPGISGLDRTLRKHRNAQNRIYGWLVRTVTGRESDSPIERRLRAIENLVATLSSSAQAQGGNSVATDAISSELSNLANAIRALTELHSGQEPKVEPQVDLSVVRGRLSPRALTFFDRVYSQ